MTKAQIRRHALADPCDECEGTGLHTTDIQPDFRADCYVAVVECDTCGHTHRRDIPNKEW